MLQILDGLTKPRNPDLNKIVFILKIGFNIFSTTDRYMQ